MKEYEIALIVACSTPETLAELHEAIVALIATMPDCRHLGSVYGPAVTKDPGNAKNKA